MKKSPDFDSNIAGPIYSTRLEKVLEDLVYYICDLCGNKTKKIFSYASVSKICTFPNIQDYDELKCPYCNELFHKKKIKRKFYESNEVVEYEVIGNEIKEMKI